MQEVSNQVTNFKDLNIPPNIKSFVGDKIQLQQIFNIPIKVIDFKVEPSKKKPGTQLLTIQIEKDGNKRIVFTGSNIMIDQISRVQRANFPFITTIKLESGHFEFT